MFKKFVFLFALCGCAFALSAQNAIDVERVDFNGLRDNWIQLEVKLACRGKVAEGAKNPNFVERIKVKPYIAWKTDSAKNEFSYYSSEVEVVIMEKGDDNNVYFYLPGLIVERDQLTDTPDFYYIEVSVNDEVIKPQRPAFSSSITNAKILESFIKNAESNGSVNEFILTPLHLLAPGVDVGRVSDLPTFLRREPRN